MRIFSFLFEGPKHGFVDPLVVEARTLDEVKHHCSPRAGCRKGKLKTAQLRMTKQERPRGFKRQNNHTTNSVRRGVFFWVSSPFRVALEMKSTGQSTSLRYTYLVCNCGSLVAK